jgi:outer membrane protein assembly factor BamB
MNYTISLLSRLLLLVILLLHGVTTLSSCNQPSKKTKPKQSLSNRQKRDSLPQILWKARISEGDAVVEGLIPLYIYNNGIVCNGQTDSSRERLMMFNIADGTTKWEWQDVRQRREHLFILESMVNVGNTLLMRNGPRLHAINLENGKTIWSNRCADGIDVSVLGNTMFYASSDGYTWKGDATTGKVDTIFFLKHTLESVPLSIGEYIPVFTLPFVDIKHDTLIAVAYSLGDAKTYQSDAWFLVYNLSKKKVMYHRNLAPRSLRMNGIHSLLRYKNNLYLAAAQSIICYEATTGKQVWKTEFQDGLNSSAGMIIAEGKIFLHCDEWKPQTYALDLTTGKILWKEPIRGTRLGPLFYMDGVVYDANMGDGLLHAMNATTGKHLWTLECPGEQEDSNDYFRGNVTGKDGKIFVRSGLHLYCYKVHPYVVFTKSRKAI